jgi:RNA polymerase sigma-B factor
MEFQAAPMSFNSQQPRPTATVADCTDPRSEQAATAERLLREAAAATGRRREDLLDQAIVASVSLARTLASRYYRRGVDAEDLDQIAYEHLVKAARSYRPVDGSDFRSFAIPTVRGGIRHHFRDHAWAVKVPRRLQEIQTQISATEAALTARLKRWPTSHELADALGLDVKEVIEAQRAQGCFSPSSLDVPLHDGSSMTRGQQVADPADTYQLVDQIESLRPVVDNLSARDRLIFQRRFLEHQTQSEIGHEIGVSQMQISRLLGRIMLRLRVALSV